MRPRLYQRNGILTLVLISIVSLCAVQAAAADITREQRLESRRWMRLIDATEELIAEKDFPKAIERYEQIQGGLAGMVANGDADVTRMLRSHYRKMQGIYGLLVLEGYELKPTKLPEDDGSKEMEMAENEGISFTSQVAPILISKCGRCHVTRQQGGVSMVNFDALMVGPTEGKIVLPGDGVGSRIIEVIVEGDMPRGGAKVSEGELKTLQDWIAQGARFDGEDRNTGLASLVPNSMSNRDEDRARVVQATGRETVSFANDIAPILVENCNGCHITRQNARGGLNLSTFQQLIRGGASGNVIKQGDPDTSLLMGKLLGTADGQQMPAGRPALAEADIEKIKTWIKEGATFDGSSPTAQITSVVAIAKASKSTHEQLARERGALAERNWKLAMPSQSPAKVETDDFIVMGNVSEDELKSIAGKAEQATESVERLLPPGDKDYVVKGRMTIFVFKQRYDYSEFGQMVEKRQIPSDWKGHWQYTLLDAYGTLILPNSTDEYSLEALLAEQIAGVRVASMGEEIPEWFSAGVARVAASKTERDDPRVLQWQESLPAVFAKMEKPTDLFGNKLTPEEKGLASFSYVEFLMSDRRRFTRLMDQLEQGQPFEESFQKAYGGTPQQATAVWAQSLSRSGRR